MKTITHSALLAALAAAPLSAALQGAPKSPFLGRQPSASPTQNASSAYPAVPATVIPINALPFTISAPGYYQVTKNLAGAAGIIGIKVNALHAVIDLNGFALSGDGGSGTAILAPADCTVINGKIFTWNNGLSLSERARVINVEVADGNGVGVGLITGLVEACTIRNNVGKGVHSTGPATVIGCTIESNGQSGFLGGDRSLVQDSYFRQNEDGIQLGSYSQVLRCIVEDNAGNGISTGNACVVYDSSAFDNDGTGILGGQKNRILGCYTEGNSEGILATEDSLVADCTAFGNTVNGILAVDTTVQRCTVTGNPVGIVIPTVGGRIEDCTVTGSSQSAVSVAGNAWVSGNSIEENTGTGIRATSTGNRIEGNHLAQNGLGIEVIGSRNLIVRNSLDMNVVQMQIAPDNVQGPLLKTKGFVDSANPWANFDLSFPQTFP